MSDTERTPLEWPTAQPRTRNKNEQKKLTFAKKSWLEYLKALGAELDKIDVTRYVVTYNAPNSERGRDPGVALWFDRQKADDFKWQDILGIDNPFPTVDQVEAAFRSRVGPLHPDRHPNDPNFDPEPYHQLVRARKEAIGFVKGISELPRGYVIACDAYVERLHNLYAILRTIKALRDIERFGASQLLEGALGGFRELLTEKASEATHV